MHIVPCFHFEESGTRSRRGEDWRRGKYLVPGITRVVGLSDAFKDSFRDEPWLLNVYIETLTATWCDWAVNAISAECDDAGLISFFGRQGSGNMQ